MNVDCKDQELPAVLFQPRRLPAMRRSAEKEHQQQQEQQQQQQQQQQQVADSSTSLRSALMDEMRQRLSQRSANSEAYNSVDENTVNR